MRDRVLLCYFGNLLIGCPVLEELLSNFCHQHVMILAQVQHPALFEPNNRLLQSGRVVAEQVEQVPARSAGSQCAWFQWEGVRAASVRGFNGREWGRWG